MLLIRFACVALTTVVVLPSSVAGQQRMVVRGEPLSSLTARRVLAIGSLNEDNAVIGMGSTSRDSKGRYFHNAIQEPYRIRIYDRSGTLVDSLGTRGGGPGEFEVIYGLLHGPADTLIVFDNVAGRVTRVAPDGSLAGTGRLGIQSWRGPAIYLGDGRFVFSARIATRERAGYPIHVANLGGEIVASFGTLQPVYRRDQPYLDRRVIGRAPNGGVWSAHFSRYRMELWDAQLQLRRTVDRDVDWFETWEEAATLRVPRDQPPRPYIRAVQQDSSERLWVVLAVAGDHWAEAVGEDLVTPTGVRTFRVTDPTTYRHTVVEVIDLRTGRLLASTRLAIDFVRFFPDGQILSYREDALGNPYLDVWELTVTNPPTRR